MRRYLIILFAILLVGCGKTEQLKTDDNVTSNSAYNVTLTKEQRESLNNLVDATSKTLNLINRLSLELDGLSSNEKDDYLSDLLVSVQGIEKAYIQAGGKKHNEFLIFLQESPTGFYQISSNMISNSRTYTETEASTSISGLSTFVKGLAANNGFIGTDSDEYLNIFLKKVSAPGNFSKAVLSLL